MSQNKQQMRILELKKNKGRERFLNIMLFEFKQCIEFPGRVHAKLINTVKPVLSGHPQGML